MITGQEGRLIKRLFYTFLALLFFAGYIYSAELSIPADRRITWQGNVGVDGGIPEDWVNCTTAACNTLWGGSVSVSTINSAIDSASAQSVVRVPSGTYAINGQISMDQDEVILRGQGMGTTILNNSSAGTNLTTPQAGWEAQSRSITSGYTQGSTTITVSNVTGVDAGDIIRITQEDDTFNCACSGSWSCGTSSNNNLVNQSVIVSSVSGSDITFHPPLMFDFSSGLNPEYHLWYAPVTKAGLEDITINCNGNPTYCVEAWNISNSWFKNVELTGFSDSGIFVWGSSRGTIRGCKIHGAAGSADGYGVYLHNYNSSFLVEDNMFYAQIWIGVLISGSTANVIAYNYVVNNDIDWYQIAAFNANHGAHGMMNLFEGNVGNKYQDDGYHGSSSHNTLFRNHFHGVSPDSSWNRIMVDLCRYARYYNVIGNVLGDSSWTPNRYEMTGEPNYENTQEIYRLGYPNQGNNSLQASNCGDQDFDSGVKTTMVRHRNYDYYNSAIRNCSGESEGCQGVTGNDLPQSLYLAAEPDWWCQESRYSSQTEWAAVDPSTPTVKDIPAQIRYDSGTCTAAGEGATEAIFQGTFTIKGGDVQ